MPTLSTLHAFADTVELNDHVGAIEKFYAPDAITRENHGQALIQIHHYYTAEYLLYQALGMESIRPVAEFLNKSKNLSFHSTFSRRLQHILVQLVQ